MEKLIEEKGMSLNYKINGEMCSFESKEKLADFLKFSAMRKEKLLTVKSLDEEGQDYDHMQEILDLSYQAIPCIKGLQAMALYIQENGNFNDFDPVDISFLGIRCKELLDELVDIAEAAGEVYESDCKAQKLKSEKKKEVNDG